MRKIGLLSDTHGYWDDKYLKYFADCDEIWHAGDIGSDELATRLASIHPLRAVYGNIDGQNLRLEYPKIAHFQVEQVRVMMTHIGGYPGRYNPEIRKELFDTRPQLFIAGHSHILKVAFDPTNLVLSVYESGSSREKRLSPETDLIAFCDRRG